MTNSGKGDPLHGLTLKMIVTRLQEKYGWEELGRRINIKCFTSDPSINSSLKFLRRTPWARKKVETLFLETRWTEINSSIWGHDKTNTRKNVRK
ncbi:MAG: VF530 family protein [Pseudomonadota bacterium]|nr:VF530 family protein [Pseudomonadota bacterium]